MLPLGISFFTFQKIAYLVDAYRGEVRAGGFLSFALFVTFFPQLIAGPIVHHSEVIPQFGQKSTYRPNLDNLSMGIGIFVLGLAKKTVLADSIATYATPVFRAAQAGADPTLFEAWGGALAYTFQLYFDFSGYSDMAIGLALMFNIRLPINFNSPYKATNIIDFWRRWHITLSRFLRDYLYIPLGGNRHGVARRYANLMLTMLLGGLWHGAGWTFIVWGGLHGIFLVINHFWHALGVGSATTSGARPGSDGSAARTITFLAVMVAWVFFRAEDFDAATRILAGMAGLNGVQLPASYHGAARPARARARGARLGVPGHRRLPFRRHQPDGSSDRPRRDRVPVAEHAGVDGLSRAQRRRRAARPSRRSPGASSPGCRSGARRSPTAR